MESVALGLVWDLPRPVALTHVVDPEENLLIRTVSDLSGVLEQEAINLEHACVHCAIREDIVPTLARLAAQRRWETIVASLPSGAEAKQVCRLIGRRPELATDFRIAAVVAALSGDDLEHDLTGDDLLYERALGVFSDDDRGVAEVNSALIEYADLISIQLVDEEGKEQQNGLAMVRSLARPGAMIVHGWPGFDADQLSAGIHDPNCSEEWVADLRTSKTPEAAEGAWRLELTSQRPLHPERLLARIPELGTGTFRSRGCFWLPTRPQWRCAWDGAGGQLSIGVGSRWSIDEQPVTQIVVTGLLAHGDPRDRLRAAFEDCLLTDDELAQRGAAWEVWSDGLEAWLGDIR